jgi:catechol-2,3-dioxygenase
MKSLFAAAAALMIAAPVSAQLAAPNAAGITYGHVHLNVKDIEFHKKLWVEHFGGEVVVKGPLTTVKFPNALIALQQREPTGGSQGTVMDHFGFRVRDINEIKTKWRAAGYDVRGAGDFRTPIWQVPTGCGLSSGRQGQTTRRSSAMCIS